MSRHPQRRLRVSLVGTEFFRDHGGIQNINRLLLRAFSRMGERTPLTLDVFSFTDGPEHIPADFPFAAKQGATAEIRWHAAGRSRSLMSWQLSGCLAGSRPDLVLFTHVALLPLARLVRALAPGARVAVLAHGAEVWGPLPGRVAGVLPQADAFVSPSVYTAKKLAEVHGISGERVTVLPHGLDPDWAAESGAPRDEGSSRGAGRILLSVTRLSRADTAGKGVELVLQAIPAVLERTPEARYIVAGGGGDLVRLKELVERLGLESSVQFLGPCGADVLKRAYSAADVFVLPTQVEGFGVVFLEAMFHRLPVVAALASATPEVVEAGVTGLLVPPGDSRELAAALSSLLADPALRSAMGQAGRRRVEAIYTFDHFVARWERWIATQVPEAVYAARQGEFFALARAAAGAV
jgi:phosphatidylinositol alpha-1,6-mannosyltransferase